MTPASRDSARSRAAAAALAALHLPGRPGNPPTDPAPPADRAWWAGMVVETAPAAAPRVAARLLATSGIELCGGDGDRRLALVLEGHGSAGAVDAALRRDPEIVAVRFLRLFGETPEVP